MALLTENGLLPCYTSGYETWWGDDHRIAPLITGLSILPFSTPHIVAMVRYSPVCISFLLPSS